MLNLKMNRFNTLLTVLLVIGLSAACGDILIPVTGNDSGNLVTLSDCYQVRFLGLSRNPAEGTTTWKYQVEELSCAVHDMSDWILEIPACATVLEASPIPWEAIDPDPNFQAHGIQWKTDSNFQGGIFVIKLSGALMRGPIQVGVNGPNPMGMIQGPLCDPNAPTPTITLTPATPTLTLTRTATATNTQTLSGTGTFIPETPLPTRKHTKTPTPESTQPSTPVPTEDSTPVSTEPTPVPMETTTPDLTKEAASALTEEPTSIPTEAVPSPAIQPEASPEVLDITENDEILTYSCNGDAVKIRGNVNVITLRGSCSSITITGNNNRVYWESGTPEITDTGNDNSIDQNNGP